MAFTIDHALVRLAGDHDGFFARMRDQYRAWRKYRNTLKELRVLTDRDLADLGFSRVDLRRIARGEDIRADHD